MKILISWLEEFLTLRCIKVKRTVQVTTVELLFIVHLLLMLLTV